MKLAAKITFVSVIAMSAVLAASNFYAAQITFASIKKNHQQYADNMTEKLKGAIVDAWKKGGVTALNEKLAAQVSQPIARWVWFEETVTATTRPQASGDFSPVITKKQTASFISTDRDGTRNLYTYHAVDLGEPRVGGLEFTTTLEEYDRETVKDFYEFLIAVGLMAGVSILVVWIAGVRMIARPLTKLNEATQRIGDGDFSRRVKLGGNDELSQLADSINEMSQHLEDQKQAIEDETSNKINMMMQLRHSDRLKTVGRMAASIAHEIGTPLSVVSGRAALIANGKLTEDKVRQNAETIQCEIERISAMIRQVLDFARQAPTEKSAVDLNEVLIQAIGLLTPLAEKQQVELKVSLADQPAMSFVDATQVNQVLTNIIMNGVQSMPDGGTLDLGLTRRAGVSKSSKPDDYWEISVRDQGCGIPPENLESIFEPFFTTKDVGKGTGLGLSIAFGIVQELGGSIEVESEVGKGTRFQILLPAIGG